ncbi:hypothetical protein L7F22_030481 [Adiantum nelumboides]|nr:hypothetical protein [Adiantum nelumboides]
MEARTGMQRRRRPRKAGPPPPPPPGSTFYNQYFQPNAIKYDEHVQGLLQACFPGARNRRPAPMAAAGPARASGSWIAEDPHFTSFLRSILSAPQDDGKPAPQLDPSCSVASKKEYAAMRAPLYVLKYQL